MSISASSLQALILVQRMTAYLNTFALGQTDPWLLPADNEDIGLTGSERIINSVLDMDNIETSIVTFAVRDHSHSSHIAPSRGHSNDSSIEADEVGDLARSQINLNSIIDLDGRIRIPNPISMTL